MKRDLLKDKIFRVLVFLILLFAIQACHTTSNGNLNNESSSISVDTTNLIFEDSNNYTPDTNKIERDFSIVDFMLIDTIDNYIRAHFSFDNFSSEGGEGYAYYDLNSKKISQSTVTLYGEMGQTKIEYLFIKNKSVKVIITNYRYLVSLSELIEMEDDSAIQQDTTIVYFIDNYEQYDNKNKKTYGDIFQKLQNEIPLQLPP